MQDDPFARAVERAQAAEKAEADAKRQRREQMASSGARTSFRVHSSVFVAVNLLLVVIWATTTPGGYPWFIYPLLGWGIGLVAHYAAISNYMRRKPMAAPAGQVYSAPPAAAPPTYAPPAPVPAAYAPAPTPIAAPAPAAEPSASTAEQLERLADLHASGALNDAEFTAAKSKLLS